MGEEDKIKHFVPKIAGREGAGLDIPAELQPVAQFLQEKIAADQRSLQNLKDVPDLEEHIKEHGTSDDDMITMLMGQGNTEEEAKRRLAEIKKDIEAVWQPTSGDIIGAQNEVSNHALLLRQLAQGDYKAVLAYIEGLLDTQAFISALPPVGEGVSPRYKAEKEAEAARLESLRSLLKAVIKKEMFQ
jgi:hypothetical protein